jgi:putative endonuclease
VNNKDIGVSGEAEASKYLEKSGYSIIDVNVRPFPGMRRGEIDIVAWDGEVLCIVEVKTRLSRRFDASDAITVTKRRQLTRLAKAYIDKYRLNNTECRFDVMCIYNRAEYSPSDIELIRGAFDPVY